MVPEPYLTFTLPSIHDDKELDCRIYSPSFSVVSPLGGETWRPRGAVFAHPYAPLGGCFDDPVVLSVVDELLKQGFIVGTFNFRGAGSSKGSTSWTAKAEVSDYLSFTAFLLHFITDFRPNSQRSLSSDNADGAVEPMQSGNTVQQSNAAYLKLILGGYSYGSMITTRLPTTDKILNLFSDIKRGTTEAEIILRAESLALKFNKDVQIHREAMRGRIITDKLGVSSHAMAMAMGGDESEPGSRRPSRDSRRSLDLVRRSMERSRRRLGMRQHSSDDSDQPNNDKDALGNKIALSGTYYLLVSPLLPPISTLATMFSNLRSDDSRDDKLTSNKTLVVYGSNDMFTSHKKLRKWAEVQQSKAGQERFQFREVAGAGHFWREEGVEEEMRKTVERWLEKVIEGDVSKF